MNKIPFIMQNICLLHISGRKNNIMNKQTSEIIKSENLIILSILDLLSSNLHKTFVQNWSSAKNAYELSRKFCFDMHKKRENWPRSEKKINSR